MKIGFCETSGSLRTFYILGILKNILFILVPVIIILVGIITLIKALLSKEENIGPIIKKSIIKMFVGIFIFFLPTIIMALLNVIDKEGTEYLKGCLLSSSAEKAEYMSKVEDVEDSITMLQGKPSKENLEKTENKLQDLINYMDGDANRADREIIETFQAKITSLGGLVEEKEAEKKCLKDGGTWENKKCVIKDPHKPTPPKPTPGGGGGGGGGHFAVDGDTSNMISYSFNGSEYLVIDSKISVREYLGIINRNQIKQATKTKTYGGYCMAVSLVHAYNLYAGGRGDGPSSFLKYRYASKFRSDMNYTEEQILKATYNELINNRPIIIQVNGNKAGTSRHFVTAVGFKKSVTTSSTLSQGDLLIIDSWDGKLEGMRPNGSRFLVTGKDCRKSYYSGHYALSLKSTS